MKYPTLPVSQSSREITDAFYGYDRNPRIRDGAFRDMENLTSDCFPVLSSRKKRGLYADPASPQGLIAKDGLCYIDGKDFVMNGYHVDMGLSTGAKDCPKQLVSMGAYVIILPDRKWINTLDLTDFGSIDASYESDADVTFSLCRADGGDYEGMTVSASAPEEPGNLALWIDTSSVPHTLKQYSSLSGVWVSIATTYVKISCPGIGAAFSRYDGVTISGVTAVEGLNGTFAIWERGTDYIVVVGILDAVAAQTVSEGKITVERKMPEVDFLVESENRLWGCRYGLAANGEVVNEIYACKLGDFRNWNCFMNLSTDSYAASCGTDGQFTGAITHLGYPLFFKETCVHKVYGNYPGNFQIQTTFLRGVQKGSGQSLAIVNEVLYYKSPTGVCAYDGSLPEEVSGALGERRYDSAAAGSVGNKYYISMRDTDTQIYSLFVLDTARGMWHREDSLAVSSFCGCRGELYALAQGKIWGLLGTGTEEENVKWMAQTGEIGLSSPDKKYVSRLLLRLSMEAGAQLKVYVRYDGWDDWELTYCLHETVLRSFSLPIRPRRCDYLELRFEGTGGAKLYSITKTIRKGSDRP